LIEAIAGECPHLALSGSDPQSRAALSRIIDRVESLGLERIGEPHVRHIDGKLWEMRPSGKRAEGRAST